MKERYRLFLCRKSVYYAFENTNKTFQSLKTKDRADKAPIITESREKADRCQSVFGSTIGFFFSSLHTGKPISRRT